MCRIGSVLLSLACYLTHSWGFGLASAKACSHTGGPAHCTSTSSKYSAIHAMLRDSKSVAVFNQSNQLKSGSPKKTVKLYPFSLHTHYTLSVTEMTSSTLSTYYRQKRFCSTSAPASARCNVHPRAQILIIPSQITLLRKYMNWLLK
jgi:hypothetical protein